MMLLVFLGSCVVLFSALVIDNKKLILASLASFILSICLYSLSVYGVKEMLLIFFTILLIPVLVSPFLYLAQFFIKWRVEREFGKGSTDVKLSFDWLSVYRALFNCKRFLCK